MNMGHVRRRIKVHFGSTCNHDDLVVLESLDDLQAAENMADSEDVLTVENNTHLELHVYFAQGKFIFEALDSVETPGLNGRSVIGHEVQPG
ncbi:protein of unknown function [Pseudodesulfovibrio piezophilus C1TLV30]|uniref:Uncharacterized protein n=1 Tax=Pseudodesulfovibrio piezophilus (strain DSM 21447 / JCM 15486 / C1TLV30) TaxID=1322246 RepID=M1WT94_PSEP2|nr:protein of unknown function [Pseudodesulfovibrio piezophilus C1TLV30]